MRKKILVSGVVLTFLLNFVNCAEDFYPDREVFFLLMNREKNNFDDAYSFAYSDLELMDDDGITWSKPATFVIHGYAEGKEADRHVELTRALVESEDQNVIFVDWSRGSKTFSYDIARIRSFQVADTLEKFMKYMHENFQLGYDQMTIVGYSLGAHIGGIAAQKVGNRTIGKILGLDPAGPMYSVNDVNRLNKESAKYVECYHTGIWFGFKEPICHVDFYLNGGSRQPGCSNFFGLDDLACSHSRSVFIFIESMKTPKTMRGKKCENMENALAKNCNSKEFAYINDPENAKKNVNGIYHVRTYDKSPFGSD